MNELLNDDILILDSTEGLSFIGQGNTAEIYACSKDSIVKLFRDGFPEEGVKKEWEITNKVQVKRTDSLLRRKKKSAVAGSIADVFAGTCKKEHCMTPKHFVDELSGFEKRFYELEN